MFFGYSNFDDGFLRQNILVTIYVTKTLIICVEYQNPKISLLRNSVANNFINQHISHQHIIKISSSPASVTHDDVMMVTIRRCWWQNQYVNYFFEFLVPDGNVKNGYQHLKLSPTLMFSLGLLLFWLLILIHNS